MSVAVLVDPALPGLAKALDREAMTSRLRSLQGRLGFLGPDARVEAVDVLKHKPGRRCALAYTVAGRLGPGRLFAKAFQSERGASIVISMARLAEAVPRDRLLLPRPLAYFPDIRLLLTEFVEGHSLGTALFLGATREPTRRMAGAIAAFHGCGARGVRRWTAEKEIRTTTQWLTGLGGRSPGAPSRARALLERLERWSAELPDTEDHPIHRDFYPDQLLDCEGRMALVDLDDTRAGDPAVDLGNFLAHLTLRSLQFPESARGARGAREVFLPAYLETRGGADDGGLAERVRFYEASSTLRLAGVYAGRRRWRDVLPDPLVRSCGALLEGRFCR